MKEKRGGSTEEGEEKEIFKREGKEEEGKGGEEDVRETRGCEQTSRKMPCGRTSNPVFFRGSCREWDLDHRGERTSRTMTRTLFKPSK